MNINQLTNYVNLDVDDTFTVQEISRWFNKGIANYNLIPPLTNYPYVQYGGVEDIPTVYIQTSEYPLSDTFMLGIMLPFINASVRGSESSLGEKNMMLQEYMQNAQVFKHSIDVPATYLINDKNTDLSNFEVGEGVYLQNFENAPFAGPWGEITNIGEMTYEDEE